MITPDETAEVMRTLGESESISNVQICTDGSVVARFANWIEPEQPYNLLVRPVEDEHGLGVYVSSLLKVPKDSDISRMLLLLNNNLAPGTLCIKPPDELVYKIELCVGSYIDLSERLLTFCVRSVRVVESVLFFENMVERGISTSTAERIVHLVLGDCFIDEWERLTENKKL